MQTALDVIGIGNAIVDVITRTEDDFLAEAGLVKGAMKLIDEQEARSLYERLSPGIECSGGSVANSIAGLAGLGASAAFIGKVKDDQLGQVFTHDIRSLGVTFRSSAATGGAETARCLVLVSPDAQRTMATYLGASIALGPEDIDRALIKAAKVTYLEGYLWDPPRAKEAFLTAMDIAHAAGNRVAFSLSDPFCVARYRDDFRSLAEKHIDILFANEEELKSLYEVETFDEGLQAVQSFCDIAVLTRSAKGAVVVSGEEIHVIDAAPVKTVVDTTGAGDLYAAGFLYGLTQGLDLGACGRIGAIAAAEVISHYGARPEADLRALIAGVI